MGLIPAAGSVFGNMRRSGNKHSHVVQFYSEHSSLVQALARSLVPILAGGNSAIVIGTLEHRTALALALDVAGINVPELARTGRYKAEDASESLAEFMLYGRPDAARFSAYFGPLLEHSRTAAENPTSSVFVFGEMVALLWAEGASEAALQLERLWNDLSRARQLQIHCAYPVSVLRGSEDEKTFLRMCAEHTSVIPADVRANEKHDIHAVGGFAFWQQRAQLEIEIAARKRLRIQMEDSRRKAQDELEARVAERTAELSEANAQISRQAVELDRMNHGLRELSAHLLRTQDEERRRIARDLHDGTSQELALLNMSLSSMHNEARRTNSGFAAELAECSRIVKRVCSELRTLCYLLHPPLLDEVGLNSALRWFIDGFEQTSGIQVERGLPEDLGRLDPGLEVAIFRVVQECLTNVHRHSGGARASIQLRRDGGNVALQITDDGKGISAETISQIASARVSGIGLRGIRQRLEEFGGSLEIASNGNGTKIRMMFPTILAPCSEECPPATA